VTRIKPKGGNERVYIHSHDFHLFVSKAANAHPPSPPFQPSVDNIGAIASGPFLYGKAFDHREGPPRPPSTKKPSLFQRLFRKQQRPTDKRAHDPVVERTNRSDEDPDAIIERFPGEERLRVYEQIAGSRGYTDLRDIKEVRRCHDQEDSTAPNPDTQDPLDGSSSRHLRQSWRSHGERNDDEEELEGDRDGKPKSASEKRQLRLRRTIELELKTGRRIRLEVRLDLGNFWSRMAAAKGASCSDVFGRGSRRMGVSPPRPRVLLVPPHPHRRTRADGVSARQCARTPTTDLAHRPRRTRGGGGKRRGFVGRRHLAPARTDLQLVYPLWVSGDRLLRSTVREAWVPPTLQGSVSYLGRGPPLSVQGPHAHARWTPRADCLSRAQGSHQSPGCLRRQRGGLRGPDRCQSEPWALGPSGSACPPHTARLS
jgi:hypothetical protein